MLNIYENLDTNLYINLAVFPSYATLISRSKMFATINLFHPVTHDDLINASSLLAPTAFWYYHAKVSPQKNWVTPTSHSHLLYRKQIHIDHRNRRSNSRSYFTCLVYPRHTVYYLHVWWLQNLYEIAIKSKKIP